jgi:hypothetical protein
VFFSLVREEHHTTIWTRYLVVIGQIGKQVGSMCAQLWDAKLLLQCGVNGVVISRNTPVANRRVRFCEGEKPAKRNLQCSVSDPDIHPKWGTRRRMAANSHVCYPPIGWCAFLPRVLLCEKMDPEPRAQNMHETVVLLCVVEFI